MKVAVGSNGWYPLAYFLSSEPFISVFCVEVRDDGYLSCDCPGFSIKGSCHHYYKAQQNLLENKWVLVPGELRDAYVVVDAAG